MIEWRPTSAINPAEMTYRHYLVWCDQRPIVARWLPESQAWLIESHVRHRTFPSDFAHIDQPQ